MICKSIKEMPKEIVAVLNIDIKDDIATAVKTVAAVTFPGTVKAFRPAKGLPVNVEPCDTARHAKHTHTPASTYRELACCAP